MATLSRTFYDTSRGFPLVIHGTTRCQENLPIPSSHVMVWHGNYTPIFFCIFVFIELTKDKWYVIALACKRQNGNKAVGFRILYCFLSSILTVQNFGSFLQ
jgi:hypothetical protein